MDYYPRYSGDYIRDTLTLNMTEDGAYSRLLDLYYSTEKPIKKDRNLYQVLRTFNKKERDAIDKILDLFFEEKEGLFYHKRVEKEIDKYNNRLKTNRKNGSLGGRPQKPKQNPTVNPNKTQTVTQKKPIPEPEPEPEKNKPLAERAGVYSSARAENLPDPPCGKFGMRDDWIPDQQTWQANRFRAGAPDYSEAQLHEFRMFWIGEQAVFAESQWQGKLIHSLKRQDAQPKKQTPQSITEINQQAFADYWAQEAARDQ